MDKYRVQLNAQAYRDLDEIFNYISIALESPENAKGQTDRLYEAIKKLAILPQAHQKRIIGKYANKDYRQLLVDNYIVIFKIDEENRIVRIITIQYQGRNI